MEAVMRVSKADLRAKMEARIVEIDASYENGRLGKYRRGLELLEAGGPGVATREGVLASWHEDVAEGIRNGTIQVNSKGGLRGAPPKPKPQTVVTIDADEDYSWVEQHTVDSLKRNIKHSESQKADAIRPLRTAIELLDLSEDEIVTINTADYQKLLS